MPSPLAIVFHERLMPGSQLVNRLQDLQYRVLAVNNAAQLTAITQRETPLLLFIDVATPGDVNGAIAKIKADNCLTHIPIIAFAPETDVTLIEAAKKSGANFAVSETAVISHLDQLIEQALHVE
jgi:CheY-like chemotaxis protein